MVDANSPFFLANVTFEPGCRNHWHIHQADKGGGQILICTAGHGWYQEDGKEAVSLEPGKVIVIPANVKHWHGAEKDSWFSHIALEVPGENTKTEWLEARCRRRLSISGISNLYSLKLVRQVSAGF